MSHHSSSGLIVLSLRARWRRSWVASLTLALLIGAIGGFVLGAATAARRVSSAYDALLADIHAPDRVMAGGCPEATNVITGCQAPTTGTPAGLAARLEAVPVVQEARAVGHLQPFLLDERTGGPLLVSETNQRGCFGGDRSVALLALRDGGATAQAIPFALIGRLPTSGSNGIVLARATAERVALSVGDDVLLGGWCDVDGDARLLTPPIRLVLTGLSIGPFDIEPPGTSMTVEPAYVDRAVVQTLVTAGAELDPGVAIWLDHARPADEVAEQLAPFATVLDTATQTALIDASLDIDARLLWLLCLIGAIAGILLLAPIVARSLRSTADDTSTVLALGGTRRQVMRNTAGHVAIVVSIATIVAVLLAPFLAFLMPRGLADSIVSHRDLAFDGLVTIVGGALVAVVLLAMSAVPIWRSARPHAAATPPATPAAASVASVLRLGPAAHTGVMAAYGRPAGRRSASPWPSLASLCIACAVCVASLTYLAGLRRLEQNPRLLGWNWDAAVTFDDVGIDVKAVLEQLSAVDGVDRVTPGTIYPPDFLTVPGPDVMIWPWSFATGVDAVRPTMLSGRAPDGPDEMAIDPVFRAQTGFDVGDTVSIARPQLSERVFDDLESLLAERGLDGSSVHRPTSTPIVRSFEVTGIAVLPLERTQTIAQASFTLGGLAAFVEPSSGEIDAARAALPDELPNQVRIEIDRSLAAVDIEDNGAYFNITGDVLAVADRIAQIERVEEVMAPRPRTVLTEVVGLNLSRNDRVPIALVIVSALAACILLTYVVASGARARRSELAVLRTLGVSSWGIRTSITAQAVTIAVIAGALSIPVGLLIGRWSWSAYAKGLDVLPEPVMAWRGVAVLSVGAGLAVVALAAVLTLFSTRRSLATDLRAE